MEGVVVRKYKKEDRPSVRRIVCDTAAIGEPAELFFEDRGVLADFLSRYFTDYEPQSCFVAEHKGEVIGYLLGAKDTAAMKTALLLRIFPRLFMQALVRGTFFKKKNSSFIWLSLLVSLKGGYSAPNLSDYPAVLHINIDKNFRGGDAGTKLMAAYLDYLSKEKVQGVHLRTMSAKAGDFFTKQGFTLLSSQKEMVFSKIFGNAVSVYFYGKRIG
ncbi:MAG: GNAT family N-acetyltransferase [Patescibacteria group bacterium]|nr:GNAT family N-acetyltransferase [bacterium]MDZ4240574.1 GNAT family N-acetyltransferase [Patescibacteria group bacterium]